MNDAERLLGLTLDGKVFTFAKNNLDLDASPNGGCSSTSRRGA